MNVVKPPRYALLTFQFYLNSGMIMALTAREQNLEYARTLLLRLEHRASLLKTQSTKHAAQERLLQQRNLIKRLNDRLFELNQRDDWTYSDESSEGEDLIGEYISKTTSPSIPIISEPLEDQTPTSPLDRRKDLDPRSSTITTTSGLRSRRNLFPTPSSTTTAHTFNAQPSASKVSAPTTAALLEAQDSTQADLTASLVSLAAMLKRSAQSFSDDLALDKAAISATDTSLGKNTDGMDAATKRMGVLRRMSEGRWWLGRMMLYALIIAGWLVTLAFMLFGPKFRW